MHSSGPRQHDISVVCETSLPRRLPRRLPGFDYSTAGAYFVTICAQAGAPILGGIVDGEMHLSEAGCILDKEWARTATMRPDVRLGSHVVMPNHLHGILWLEGRDDGAEAARTSIGAIVRGVKAAATKRIWAVSGNRLPVFQRNYFDHVIRNEAALEKIDAYILGNVRLWEEDRFFVDHLH